MALLAWFGLEDWGNQVAVAWPVCGVKEILRRCGGAYELSSYPRYLLNSHFQLWTLRPLKHFSGWKWMLFVAPSSLREQEHYGFPLGSHFHHAHMPQELPRPHRAMEAAFAALLVDCDMMSYRQIRCPVGVILHRWAKNDEVNSIKKNSNSCHRLSSH